jgi:uncharacterized alpha-E superfamily protein
MTGNTPLLARYAECLFWMARYMERLENLARLIDVTQTYESPGLESEAWDSLVRIHADEEHLTESQGTVDPDAVKRYYMLDRSNPNSIVSSIEAARINARALRPLISTEMWKHLNDLHRDILRLTDQDLDGDKLSRLCSRLKEMVQAHTGITEGTLFRDQGWHFYEMGRLIERADQTTRLLDIKFHRLTPKGSDEQLREERTQFGAMLRAVAGYHAFRRIAPVEFAPKDVVGFMLADPCFPRSILLCLSQTEWHLSRLRTTYGLRGTRGPLEQIEDMRAALLDRSAEQIISIGLHDFLDGMQQDLTTLASQIGDAFFRDRPPAAQANQSQSQVMGQP